MFKHVGTTAIAAFLTLSSASLAVTAIDPLVGDWVQTTGDNTVRISPCAQGRGLCATVIAEKRAAGEPSMLNRIAVRDIVPGREGEWTGVFQDDEASMAATIYAANASRISLKICARPSVCDTMRYRRLSRER